MKRWTEKISGKSTDYAKDKAKTYEAKFLNEKAANDLNAEIAKEILADNGMDLDRNDINMTAHKVSEVDMNDKEFGLIKLLEKAMPAVFKTSALKQLSYAHMFKSSRESLAEEEKDMTDINYIELGDSIEVVNGSLIVTRGAIALEKGFKDIKVDLYPWVHEAEVPDTGEHGGGIAPE
jgi:hypothetical protein